MNQIMLMGQGPDGLPQIVHLDSGGHLLTIVASNLLRTVASINATIVSGSALSGVFDMSLYTMSIIHMPAVWETAYVGFKVGRSTKGVFLPLYDNAGSLVQISGPPTVNKAYSLPPELAGCHYVKLWSQNGSGVDVIQSATVVIGIDIKS